MKRILLILCLLLSGLPFYAQQTGKVTAKFFPDPQVDIDTPAFAKKHGFTTYREMMTFLHDLATTYPERVSSIQGVCMEMNLLAPKVFCIL